MLILTQDAVIQCAHAGQVKLKHRQNFVAVERRLVLVHDDPEGRDIAGCPFTGPGIKPCLKTLKVRTGYSAFVRIANRRVCLDSLLGLTDGTPPGSVKYEVRTPGQNFIRSEA
jgi:hypothetical protein